MKLTRGLAHGKCCQHPRAERDGWMAEESSPLGVERPRRVNSELASGREILVVQ